MIKVGGFNLARKQCIGKKKLHYSKKKSDEHNDSSCIILIYGAKGVERQWRQAAIKEKQHTVHGMYELNLVEAGLIYRKSQSSFYGRLLQEAQKEFPKNVHI